MIKKIFFKIFSLFTLTIIFISSIIVYFCYFVLNEHSINIWSSFIILYILLSFVTFLPTLKAIFNKVKLNPGGDSFEKSIHFTKEEIKQLEQHYSRISGTLGFWKNQAEKFRSFHSYCLYWTIPSSILIPVIIQYADNNPTSKILLTVISTHTAILLGFHRGFKIEDNFKAFRLGESDFYDTYKRLLDRPSSFGENSSKQIENYFTIVENIRKFSRNAETDNLPKLDDSKKK